LTPAAGRPALISLLTDFGDADAYVGVMKGVALGINPQARLVDLTHQVRPQDILQGAFLLGTAWRFFLQGTIHVAVVDPGVGTGRRVLLVQGEGHSFLAPDNGLLSFVLPPDSPTNLPAFAPYTAPLPSGFLAYTITNPRYWLPKVSATFHGRDVFAPAAAHLSLGVSPSELGEPLTTVTRLHVPTPHKEGNRLSGCVLHVDWFGNIVTNILPEALADMGRDVTVEIGGRRIRGLAKTYAEGPGLVALAGSHGYLEVALPNGNAARETGAKVGDEVIVSG